MSKCFWETNLSNVRYTSRMRAKVLSLIIGGFLCLSVLIVSQDGKKDASPKTLEEISEHEGLELEDGTRRFTFAHGVDAVSIRSATDDIDLSVRAREGSEWTDWETLMIEKEFDPLLRESNLVMFQSAVFELEVRGSSKGYVVHAIRVSDEPVHTQLAAVGNTSLSSSRVMSRREWGADDELLYVDSEHQSTERSDVGDNGAASSVTGEASSGRVDDCEQMQQNYPNEFKVATTLTKGPNGRKYRWPVSYSKAVKLLVVHHTAMKVTGETRSGVDRMRALYAYHSVNRGWGDIGYNFVIDENGAIYEGKEGGSSVVAGHAYCNNVGTIGISLMGNFDTEQPSQKQMESLKHLLDDLAKEYNIDLDESTTFHGKTYASPIVGHGDLLSTDCPGYYVKQTMPQIRQQTIAGNFATAIKFPPAPSSGKPTVKPRAPSKPRVITKPIAGLSAAGGTTLQMNPGGRQRITLSYTAPADGLRPRSRLGQIKTSDKDLGLWLETGDGNPLKLTSVLVMLERLKPNEHVGVQILVQAPTDAGSYWFEIGGVRFDVVVQGRRSRVNETSRPAAERVSEGLIRSGVPLRPTTRASSSSSSVSSATTRSSSEHTIRVLLTALTNPTVSFGSTSTQFTANGSRCEATINGTKQSMSVLRIENVGIITLKADGKQRMYRGVIECRIENGAPIIINELPLEEYLMGLAEEPDTEPYEKQRAFAIAARSYALYYMDPSQRKFPGKPYDGSDSPATFQAYAGYGFEQNNPHWLDARESTANMVLTVNNNVIKVPYFSSDDGRTRAPSEVGWSSFPHASIFSSKADPWCKGMENRGHGVGMSGCGAKGQANEGKTGEEILKYYYPGATIQSL